MNTLVKKIMELKDRTIVILGAAKFDGVYESTSFTMAKYLARNNDVFYVDYPYTWKDYFKKDNLQQFNIRKGHFFSKDKAIITTTVQRLRVMVMPLLFSINFLPEGPLYRFLLRLNEAKIRSRINFYLKKNNVSDFIYINSFNFHYPDIPSQWKSCLKVYQCVDPLIIDYDKRHGSISEALAVRQSDLVVCTSKQLYREKLLLNKHTYFVPNAADINHSSKANDPELEVNKLLENVKRPIIGYFGNIERRIDFELLEKVIDLNPDKSFVFTGPWSPEFLPHNFRDIPNVIFTGSVPFEEMPSILKGFDIAIIPFKKDEVSASIFPLKLFEYLGTGKPVVCTDFNTDLKEFTGDVVPYCSDYVEFSRQLNWYLLNDNEALKKSRLNLAHENTWERRMEQLAALLLKHSSK